MEDKLMILGGFLIAYEQALLPVIEKYRPYMSKHHLEQYEDSMISTAELINLTIEFMASEIRSTNDV